MPRDPQRREQSRLRPRRYRPKAERRASCPMPRKQARRRNQVASPTAVQPAPCRMPQKQVRRRRGAVQATEQPTDCRLQEVQRQALVEDRSGKCPAEDRGERRQWQPQPGSQSGWAASAAPSATGECWRVCSRSNAQVLTGFRQPKRRARKPRKPNHAVALIASCESSYSKLTATASKL